MSFWRDLTGIFESRHELICPQCKTELVVKPEMCGKLCRCPHCKLLFKVPDTPPEKALARTSPSLRVKLERLSKDRVRRKLGEEEMLRALEAILADGVITAEEEQQLEAIARRHELDPEDVRTIRAKYADRTYAKAVVDGRVSSEEERGILRVCDALGVPSAKIIPSSPKYQRMRLLGALQAGELPIVAYPNVFLKAGETCHHEVQAGLLDERVIDRYFEGASSGFSFRICRGVSYRIGSFRGHPVVQRGIVQVDRGLFSITSQRLIFAGMKKTISAQVPKVVSVSLYSDAVAIKAEGRGKTTLLKIPDPEIIGSVISMVINREV